jgi:hypothetical protein
MPPLQLLQPVEEIGTLSMIDGPDPPHQAF